jgi:transposase
VLDAIHRYNNDSLDGLRDRRETNPGAPTLLSDADLLLLAQTIQHDFEQGVVWRGSDVQAWVEDTLGQPVHYQRAYELLEAIGFSLQVPRPRHIKSSDATRTDCKKTHSQKLLKLLERLLEKQP